MQSLCFFWRDIFYQISQTALQHIAQAFYQKMGCAEAEVWDPDGVARTVNQNWKTTFELGWMPGTYSAKNKAGETIMTVEIEYASDSMEQYIKISKNGNSVFGDELKRVPHPMPLWLQIRRQEQRYGLIMTASKR